MAFKVDTEHLTEFFSDINFERIKDGYSAIGQKPWKVIFLPFLLTGTLLYFVYLIIYGIFVVLALLQQIPLIGWFLSVPFIIIPIVILTVLGIVIKLLLLPCAIFGGLDFDKVYSTDIGPVFGATLKKAPKKIIGLYSAIIDKTRITLELNKKGDFLWNYHYPDGKEYIVKGKYVCIKINSFYLIEFSDCNMSLPIKRAYVNAQKYKVALALEPTNLIMTKIR